MELKYILKKEDENKTINQILSEQYNLSNRLFSKLINNKCVYLNNKNIDTRLKGKQGDKLKVNLDYSEESENIISKKIDLDIVYEDDGMIILNKPAGIAVHPSILHYEDSLASGVKFYFEKNDIHKKIRPVNRLDLNTSGLIIFAKNEFIQESLIRANVKSYF